MRIAFYAPLKSPTHGTPSGDRRVAGLLMDALGRAGHRVELVSTFRSYDAGGDPGRQAGLRTQGIALGRRLADQWRDGPAAARPDLWFTYHAYYKAPDWLGPEASSAMGIPYVIAEASYAAKRAGGPWDIGHRGALEAVQRAGLLLCPTRDDMEGLRGVTSAPQVVAWLPPFLDPAPFRAAAGARAAQRAMLARTHGLDTGVPWIAVVAMMREGDKLASYRVLAGALARLQDLPWRLLVAGDGTARATVEALLAASIAGRAVFLGALGLAGIAALNAAADFCAWPAVNEAYGMAMLEAQAAGLPVVSCATRGVPDVVEHGRTGLLAPSADEAGLAAFMRELMLDRAKRTRMGEAAAAFVAKERSLEATVGRLQEFLACIPALAAAGKGSH
ncbi:MAG TPA: glycosyltransferase family 4 protein [Burkholderiales bacterium]|nr:glycosyltransferase family 4 protein [Burkholderiales bacterium]